MAERDLSEDIDALRADLEALRRDFARVVETAKDTASSRAQSEIDELQQRLNKLAGEIQSGGRESLRAVEEQVESRPLMSVALAFAIGLILGRAFDRR